MLITIDGVSPFPHEVRIENIRIAPFTNASPFHPFGEEFESLQAKETEASEREGEDLMLSDVLAFDLRVFDPGAPLRRYPPPPSSGPDVPYTALDPSDIGWTNANPTPVVGYGSFVDLGWDPTYPAAPLSANEPTPLFQYQRRAGWHPNNASSLTGFPSVYDTWSFHYEDDDLDQDQGQDNGAGIDQGTNGEDEDDLNGPDDPAEREAPPPYNVPLRGIQVKLRVFEPDTGQIRQATVTRNFVPSN